MAKNLSSIRLHTCVFAGIWCFLCKKRLWCCQKELTRNSCRSFIVAISLLAASLNCFLLVFDQFWRDVVGHVPVEPHFLRLLMTVFSVSMVYLMFLLLRSSDLWKLYRRRLCCKMRFRKCQEKQKSWTLFGVNQRTTFKWLQVLVNKFECDFWAQLHPSY